MSTMPGRKSRRPATVLSPMFLHVVPRMPALTVTLRHCQDSVAWD